MPNLINSAAKIIGPPNYKRRGPLCQIACPALLSLLIVWPPARSLSANCLNALSVFRGVGTLRANAPLRSSVSSAVIPTASANLFLCPTSTIDGVGGPNLSREFSTTALQTIFQAKASQESKAAQAGAASGDASDIGVLEPNKPVKGELAGGETHSYRITLDAGQFVRVVVDQPRINIALSAFDPSEKLIIEADMFGIGDPEEISLVSATPGPYKIKLRSPDPTAPKGQYQVEVRELRAATDKDRAGSAALTLVAEGLLLYASQTADSYRKAIDKYNQSVPLWQSVKDPAWEATAYYLMAGTYLLLGEKEKAFDYANRALPVAHAAAQRPGDQERRLGIKVEANALDTLGRAHTEYGDRKKALELFNQALQLHRSIGDRVGEINTLNNLGIGYNSTGDARKALEFFTQIRSILAELGDHRKEATVLSNMCVIRSNLGAFKKALDDCNQSLVLKREVKDRAGEATTLDNLGTVYASMGEYQKALDAHLQCLSIYRELGNSQGVAITLNNIGWVYATLGEYEKATDYYNQALKPLREIGDKGRMAITLNNIGVNYGNLKDYRKALEIDTQALLLRREAGDKGGEAISLNNIAYCHRNMGDRQTALEYYDRALALHREVGDPRQLATALRNVGELHRDLGDTQKALDCYNEALQISRSIGDKLNEAGTLALFARLERDRGNEAKARTLIEQALEAVESLRVNVKSYQLRSSFLASVRKYYEFDIDVLMRLNKQRPSEGFDAAALRASEQGRARSLLELIAEAGAEIRRDVDQTLLERETELRRDISNTAQKEMQLRSVKHTQQQAEAAASEIDNLTTQYEQVQAQIRERSPRYAALTQPVPLTLEEIQREVVDNDTLLLEFALGDEKSFLWAVTPAWIKSFELPKRAEIEPLARRVYELLTSRNKVVASETPARHRLRIREADNEFPKAAAELSGLLLGPVASELKNRRLLIVGDGVLQYLPFAALPSPVSPATQGANPTDASALPGSSNPPPLNVDHEIVRLPSASVLAVLRREASGRKPTDKTVAVFADPVFESSDPRVKQAVTGHRPRPGSSNQTDDVKRSASECGLRDFVRLRFSRDEAERIVRLASNGKGFEAVDFAANREAATSEELRHYAILHFATHGLINNQHPELSGVVLSLVDQQGRPQDGFLRLYDIYNTKLDADLVVLSACQTALGKEVAGEGLVGLTRGFMYAGASRVVASLWQVEDRATAELMGRFYQAMLSRGERPGAALRSAQVSMWRDKRWQAPYYWAAFTLQGEWK
jgi:CHAT domain-containing protein/Tfp pilus assembly protein PilF